MIAGNNRIRVGRLGPKIRCQNGHRRTDQPGGFAEIKHNFFSNTRAKIRERELASKPDAFLIWLMGNVHNNSPGVNG